MIGAAGALLFGGGDTASRYDCDVGMTSCAISPGFCPRSSILSLYAKASDLTLSLSRLISSMLKIVYFTDSWMRLVSR